MLDSIKPPGLRKPIKYSDRPIWHKPRARFRLWLVLIMLVLLIIGISTGSKLVIFAQKILEGKGQEFSFRRFFISDDKMLIGEDKGRIHILLLGIGGEKHEGGTLTDTMILATIELDQDKKQASKVGLLSTPRDLLVNIPGYDFRKINSAYAYGEASLTLKTVEQVLGLTVPYYAVIDFEGFKKAIDDIGGITITVEQGFTDASFPDDKGGYLHPVTFEAGKQKMDGERALQFVRSRHGNNNQGTDFARSRRQQLVLKAIKDKLSGFYILSNLNLINRALEDLSGHIRTNFNPYELKRLYSLTKNIETQSIFSLALNHDNNLVCDQIQEETGAYTLIPCEGLGKYDKIRNLVQNQFLLSTFQAEQPSVEIQNTSSNRFWEEVIKEKLNLPYLKTVAGSFKGGAIYEESIIYDNTGGQKPKTLEYLKDKLGMRVARGPFPFSTSSFAPDFVIILAKD